VSKTPEDRPVAQRSCKLILLCLALALTALAARAERAPGSTVLPDIGGADPAWGTEATPGTALPLSGGATGPLIASRALPLSAVAVPPLGTRMPGRGRSGPDRRCTADGLHCIALVSYVPDVCRTIEATAREAGLDPHFFARLLWQESGFDANAVSHAGAQGIAQFMPGTAELRGLADPFNPAEALRASAALLVDLKARFGNLGLAAAAYNAGEGRVARFVARQSGLPSETRAYVPAITGLRAETWRDGRPAPDLRLRGEMPFAAACEAMAGGRSIVAFADPAPAATAPDRDPDPDGAPSPAAEDAGAGPDPTRPPPWGAMLVAHRRSAAAATRYARLAERHPDLMAGLEPVYVRRSLPGESGPQVTAQIAAADEAEATALCARLGEGGVPCRVIAN
jgi:hypothetical protein